MAELKPLSSTGLEALASYLARFHGIEDEPHYWLSRFRLWWDENPAFSPDMTRGWILEVNGQIVGFLGSIPSGMLINGRKTIVRSLTTWMVDEPFRNESLSMLLEFLQEAGDTPIFDTTPTDHVSEILRNLNFRPLPWGSEKEQLYATDPKQIGGAILGSLFKGVQGLRSNLKIPKGLRVDKIEALSQTDYDALWEKTASIYATTNIRDGAAVKWNALSDKIVQKKLLECRDAGKLRGYLILKPRLRRGQKTFECVDLWTDPDHSEAFNALIATAAKEPPMVTFPHFTMESTKQLKKFGMIEIPIRTRKNLWLAPEGVKNDRSFFCLLQGDYGTAP